MESPPPTSHNMGKCFVSAPNHFVSSVSPILDIPKTSPLWRACNKMPGQREFVLMATNPSDNPKIIVGRNFSRERIFPLITWKRPKRMDVHKTLRKGASFDRKAESANPRKKNSSATAGTTAPVSSTSQNGINRNVSLSFVRSSSLKCEAKLQFSNNKYVSKATIQRPELNKSTDTKKPSDRATCIPVESSEFAIDFNRNVVGKSSRRYQANADGRHIKSITKRIALNDMAASPRNSKIPPTLEVIKNTGNSIAK